MKLEIKQRIEQIKNGKVPQGYKKTKISIVPSEWKVKTINNIANISSGLTPSRDNKLYWNGSIPWITTTLINNKSINYANEYITHKALTETALKVIPQGTILMAMYGQGKTRGQVAILEFDATINQACAAIQIEKHNVTFTFFYLKSQYEKIRNLSNVGNQENLNAEIIKSIKLPIPPLHEQQRIADILSTQDKVIELKEKLIAEKQKQKKYLMQTLLTGKKRLKGFTGEWKYYQLNKLGTTYSGLTGKNKNDFGIGKPYIPYLNIYSNPFININELDYVNILDTESQCKVKYGDIFFTTSSETPEEVGMSSVLLSNVDELYLNSFCFGYRLNSFDVLLPNYAAYYFRGNDFRILLNKLAQGATRFNLSKNNLLKSKILLPPIEEQTAIANILSTADKEIELLEQDLEQEKKKKKALMQLLLTGIVRV